MGCTQTHSQRLNVGAMWVYLGQRRLGFPDPHCLKLRDWAGPDVMGKVQWCHDMGPGDVLLNIWINSSASMCCWEVVRLKVLYPSTIVSFSRDFFSYRERFWSLNLLTLCLFSLLAWNPWYSVYVCWGQELHLWLKGILHMLKHTRTCITLHWQLRAMRFATNEVPYWVFIFPLLPSPLMASSSLEASSPMQTVEVTSPLYSFEYYTSHSVFCSELSL